jgi:hypothetical protein
MKATSQFPAGCNIEFQCSVSQNLKRVSKQDFDRILLIRKYHLRMNQRYSFRTVAPLAAGMSYMLNHGTNVGRNYSPKLPIASPQWQQLKSRFS